MISVVSVAVRKMTSSPTIAPGRSSQVIRKPYPNYKVIVLNDDFNTFQHVSDCLMKYIPGMTKDRAWKLTNQVHYEGQATIKFIMKVKLPFGLALKSRRSYIIPSLAALG